LSYLANTQTGKQTNKQSGKSITFLAEVKIQTMMVRQPTVIRQQKYTTICSNKTLRGKKSWGRIVAVKLIVRLRNWRRLCIIHVSNATFYATTVSIDVHVKTKSVGLLQ